jgi:Spy/CpxP family protein refolding chaperone
MSSSFFRGLALVALTATLPVAAAAQVVPMPPGAQQAPAGPGGAQGGGQNRRGGNAYLRAIRQLTLTDAQRQQIRQIMRQQEQETRRQITAVLTPAQRAQLQQQMQQMRSQNGGAPGQNGQSRSF